MGGKKRVSMWKSADQGDTVADIGKAIAPACPQLFMNGGIYPSEDMKTGIDVSFLVTCVGLLLTPLLMLDPRGGFFSQQDVNDAVLSQGELPDNKPHMESAALQQKWKVATFLFRSFLEACLTDVCGRAVPDLGWAMPDSYSLVGRAMPDSCSYSLDRSGYA